MQDLRQKVEAELLSDILPFWLKYAIDEEYGGFRGQIANDLTIDPRAAKGLILNARILWTFSKAFNVYRNPVYLDTARRAYEYLVRFFWDHEFGGVYWMVDFEGRPIDTKKRIYGQAFTVYALAEYYHATEDAEILARALRLVEKIEAAGHDDAHGGYFETLRAELDAGRRPAAERCGHGREEVHEHAPASAGGLRHAAALSTRIQPSACACAS